MNVLDLFSGIGGFSLGLERAGFRTVAFCEINEWARRVLAKHWPNVPQMADVTAIGIEPMSSAEASPARTSASPAEAPELPAAVPLSGGGFAEPFAWYDRNTRSWRTWQRCLIEGWTPYRETWPRSGMTRSGIAYRLPTLAPLTEEIESGLWRTPQAGEGNGGGQKGSERVKGGHAMWPTPTSRDWRSESCSPEYAQKRNAETRGKTLPWAVMFDTPRTTPRTARELDGVSPLGNGGLNPTWVEWLMGYLIGWTVLPDSGTRSSRKSRKSSGGQS